MRDQLPDDPRRVLTFHIDRRRFLQGSALATVMAALAACGSSSSPATSTSGSGGAATASSALSTSTTAAGSATRAAGSASPSASPAAAGATGATRKTLTIATGGDISVLNPQLSTSNNDIQVSFNIFDNLVARHPDGKLYPMLATEWHTTNDTTWEFKLRNDVKFHNGDPFTSADVKFTIERTYDPNAKTLVATVFASVDHIETPDDYTVRFITKQPDPLLDARLAFYGGQIMPKKYFEQVGADGFNDKPVGSGPVQFVEWKKDDHLTLAANKNYWGGAIAVEQVIFKPIPELASRVASIQAGQSDIVVNLTPDTVDKVNNSGKAKVANVLYAGLYVLAVNSKVKPLDNPLVKQALNMAIDRDSIVKDVWRGMGVVPNGPVPKGDVLGYDPNKPPYKYDPEKAKQLLKQAGYSNEPIYLETTDGYIANDKPMSDAIAAMWQDIGINVVEEVIQYSVRAQKNREKSFKGLFWSDPTSTLGDPDGMMWRLLGPGGSQDYWRDPEWDRLGTEAHNSLDPKLRAADYAKMNDIFDQNFPWLPVIQPQLIYGVANGIDWQPNGNQELDVRAYNLKVKA